MACGGAGEGMCSEEDMVVKDRTFVDRFILSTLLFSTQWRFKSRGLGMSVLASWKAQRARKRAAKRAKAYSDEIDRQIQEDSKKCRRECDILLMGLSAVSI